MPSQHNEARWKGGLTYPENTKQGFAMEEQFVSSKKPFPNLAPDIKKITIPIQLGQDPKEQPDLPFRFNPD